MGSFWSYLSVSVLMITGVLMIFIILLQRGRGGGLAGAFGGAGGQSALGTKAGDVFTRITIGLAVIWVFLACMSIYALRAGSEGRLTLPAAAAAEGESLVPPDADAEPAPGAAGQNAAGDTNAGGPSQASAQNADGSDRPADDTTGRPANNGSTPANGGNPADITP